MKITRDVITDLLPAYVSGEASRDTRALVDEYLETDPAFASIVQDARREPEALLQAQPRAMAPDQEREAVGRTRAVIRRQSWTLAFAILLTLLPLSVAGDSGGVRFFMLRDEPLSALLWIPAAGLWLSYVRTRQRLGAAGL